MGYLRLGNIDLNWWLSKCCKRQGHFCSLYGKNNKNITNFFFKDLFWLHLNNTVQNRQQAMWERGEQDQKRFMDNHSATPIKMYRWHLTECVLLVTVQCPQLLFTIKDRSIFICLNVINENRKLAVDSSRVMIHFRFLKVRSLLPPPIFSSAYLFSPFISRSLYPSSTSPSSFFVRHIFVVGLPECGSSLTGSALTAWHFPHLPPSLPECVCGWKSL